MTHPIAGSEQFAEAGFASGAHHGVVFGYCVSSSVKPHRNAAARVRLMPGWKKGGFATAIDQPLADFIAGVRSFYLATANKDGQPYIQHRGGPPGFLRVLDARTIAFAEFSGNRQYITTGNLEDNPRAMMFLMDYANRRRVKIWGTARVIENDPRLIARLFPEGYRARAEAAILFSVEAWDVNCPQHIPQMLFAEDVAEITRSLEERIERLEFRKCKTSCHTFELKHLCRHHRTAR